MRKRLSIVSAILIFILFLCGGGGASAYDAGTYRLLFAPEYAAAESMAGLFYAGLLSRLGDEELSRVGIAVVFPELTRYSYIRDVAETKALELSYALGGNVDFSIGKMQMKPSFAEKIESLASPELTERFPALSQAHSGSDTRAKRIQRLKDDEGQLDYLAAFLLLMAERFPETAPGGSDAVFLLSAAYNAGFERSLEELYTAAKSYRFPYGASFEGEQFNYTEIALQYYEGEKP